MSIPISPLIPHPPFLPWCPYISFVLYICVSDGLYQFVQIPHIYINIYLFFWLHPVWQCLGEGSGTPLQYSCLENPMDGGTWKAAVHGVAKSRTRLSSFTFTFHFHASEKKMATHSSVLAWRIPGTAEPGGLPSMGLHRVGHDWSDLAAAVFRCIYLCVCVCVCVNIYAYIHHIFFIHSSFDGHLGCSPVLAIVNSATVNIRVHVSLWQMCHVCCGQIMIIQASKCAVQSNREVLWWKIMVNQEVLTWGSQAFLMHWQPSRVWKETGE